MCTTRCGTATSVPSTDLGSPHERPELDFLAWAGRAGHDPRTAAWSRVLIDHPARTSFAYLVMPPRRGEGMTSGPAARRTPRTVPDEIRALRVQRHPDREVRHHPRRQRSMPALGPARLRDHLINQTRREHPGQHPDGHQIRQPPIRLRLLPPGTRHTTKLHRCNTN